MDAGLDITHDDLLADIPLERKSEADVARAVAASQFWPMIYTAMQSWFETGAHVDLSSLGRGRRRSGSRPCSTAFCRAAAPGGLSSSLGPPWRFAGRAMTRGGI